MNFKDFKDTFWSFWGGAMWGTKPDLGDLDVILEMVVLKGNVRIQNKSE